MQEFNEKATIKNPFNFFTVNWKYNVVKDAEAPELFSRQAICLFSSFFSVLLGGILLASNLKKVNRKDAIWIVILYSVVYTILQGIFLSQFVRDNRFTFFFSMFGSFALINTFWKKYIGIEVKYRKKSIWIPLLICISIVLMMIILLLVTHNTESSVTGKHV